VSEYVRLHVVLNRAIKIVAWPNYLNKNVFSDRRNLLYDKSASFRCDGIGRLFHSPGPAADFDFQLAVPSNCARKSYMLAILIMPECMKSCFKFSITLNSYNPVCFLLFYCFVWYVFYFHC